MRVRSQHFRKNMTTLQHFSLSTHGNQTDPGEIFFFFFAMNTGDIFKARTGTEMAVTSGEGEKTEDKSR